MYTDSYGGGGSILLSKPRSAVEVYNDRDDELVNLFQVARDRGEELQEALRLTPYARSEFEQSYHSAKDPLEQARRTVVRSYMGHGSTMTRLTVGGRLMKTGFRTYSKLSGRTAPVHDWRSYPEALPAIIERLRGVIIESQSALKVIRTHDGPDTLHYVDPNLFARAARTKRRVQV